MLVLDIEAQKGNSPTRAVPEDSSPARRNSARLVRFSLLWRFSPMALWNAVASDAPGTMQWRVQRLLHNSRTDARIRGFQERRRTHYRGFPANQPGGKSGILADCHCIPTVFHLINPPEESGFDSRVSLPGRQNWGKLTGLSRKQPDTARGPQGKRVHRTLKTGLTRYDSCLLRQLGGALGLRDGTKYPIGALQALSIAVGVLSNLRFTKAAVNALHP
ncbi:MAG: hypothetical protein JWN34_723 [Bryobacterales bacterium]|nr:hypothetical protein [Bryobacterales bacterium]